MDVPVTALFVLTNGSRVVVPVANLL